MVDKNRLSRTALELLKINSENPPGNEVEIAEYVKTYLVALGVKVVEFEPVKNRKSILGFLGNGPQLFYCAHTDVVPAIGVPGPNIAGDVLVGRGAVDNKGPLASVLEATTTLVDSGEELKCQLVIGALADEEEGSILGARKLLAAADKINLRPVASIVTEPSNFEIELGEMGSLRFKAYAKGKAAHASRPELGINAIYLLSDFIQEFRKLKFEAKAGFRPTTLNVGTIKGGTKQSIVPDYCDIDVDVRLNPAQSKETILAAINKIEEKLKLENSDFNLSTNVYRYDAPHEVSGELSFVKLLKNTVAQFGLPSKTMTESGVSIAKFLNLAGFPAVVFGPGNPDLCHAAGEQVAISDLALAAEIYKNYALIFSGETNVRA